MSEQAPVVEIRRPPVPPGIDPLLTEVHLLMRARTPEGEYPEAALRDIFDNVVSDSYESAVPNGVAKLHHEAHDGEYWWMGMGSVENAQNGYSFYKHEFAHRRVDVDIEEAEDARDNLVPGWAKVTISPKAAGTSDATYDEAKAENLHDRDLIRIQYLETDENGTVTGKFTESAQAFGVPLDAWVALLESGDFFEQPVPVSNPDSALAVHQTHRQTYIPMDRLEEGPVTLLRAVREFVEDELVLADIDNQLEKFAVDQEEIRRKVEQTNLDRIHFLCQLTDSCVNERATDYITQYVNVHLTQFGGQQRILINHMRQPDGTYRMNEEFAKICSAINKVNVAVRTGVVVDNKALMSKLGDDQLVDRIQREITFAYHNQLSPQQQLHMMRATNVAIAESGVRPSGGCSVNIDEIFGRDNGLDKLEREALDAFGPKKDENGEESYDFDEEAYCVVCQDPPKPNETKKMCGPCGICETCDTKIRAKTIAA